MARKIQMNKMTTNQQYWTVFIVQCATRFVLPHSSSGTDRNMWKILTYKFCCMEV